MREYVKKGDSISRKRGSQAKKEEKGIPRMVMGDPGC